MSKIYQPPIRFFEEQGVVSPKNCYFVPLENVTNTKKQDIKTMVNIGRYFTIFAPRQSGKTTFFYDFCRSIEKDPLYMAILLSFQSYQNISSLRFYELIDVQIKEQIVNRLVSLQCDYLEQVKALVENFSINDHTSFYIFFKKINSIITQKKIVIFIDEFDGIPMSELGNFLLTLRDLYQNYKHTPQKALYSVGLVGIRNITKLIVGGVSPFNIADQVQLPPFSIENVRDLYSQYTLETNQPFNESAIQTVYEQTCGQPWLVNRLGTILTVNIKPKTIESITQEDVNEAINFLLKENNSHFDNLYEKIFLYKDTFSRILKKVIPYNPYDQAQSWLRQYGLIKEVNSKAVIANPIYEKCFSNLPSIFPVSAKQNKKIFICYSRKDEKWLNILLTHLKVLEHEGIQLWYDKNIQTGETWEPEIANAIENSQLTVCLISTHFLASDYIRTREFPAVLNRYEQGMHLFPILLENCAWKRIEWLKRLQINPKNGEPLEQFDETEQKKILIQFVDEIGNALQ